MSSAESSLPTQSPLLMAYHQQGYHYNPRKEMDLLSMSQADFVNQLSSFTRNQNPHALLGGPIPMQTESPERLLLSHSTRKLTNEPMGGLFALSQSSTNDPYSARLQNLNLTNPLLKRIEDNIPQTANIGLERGFPQNSANQLNSIVQLLEANELKAQTQKNLNELLLLQMNNNNAKALAGASNNIGGFPFYMNYPTSVNYGALPSNQGLYFGQNLSEKPTQARFPQETPFADLESIVKRHAESTQSSGQKRVVTSTPITIENIDYESMGKVAKQPAKSVEIIKSASSEKNLFNIQRQNQIQIPKQEKQLNNLPNQPKPASPPVQEQNKVKQTTTEIVIQDELEKPVQKAIKEIKETQQPTMIVEAPAPETNEYVSFAPAPAEQTQKEEMKIKPRKCFNRLCLTDPNNNKLWSKQIVKNSAICKVCYDAYSKGQHCYFCQQIYLDDETSASSDDKDWIECEACQTWNHIECEEANGIKNLRTLLARDLHYKYYCPNCKSKNTSTKSPIRTIKSASRQPSQSKPNSPPASVEAESIKTPIQHSRPPLDDNLVSTEGLKEPQIRKVRLLEEYKVQSTEGSVKQADSVAETPKDDPVKKKLDMMFNKHQLKKRLQGKPLISHNDTHSAIEKLLGQYGGRKLQLSDMEIRNDLDLFRELSSLNGQAKKGVKREDDLNTVSTVSSLVRDATVFTITQSPIPNKNSRGFKGKRGGFNKFTAEDNDQKEGSDMNELMESDGNGTGRILRNRRRLD